MKHKSYLRKVQFSYIGKVALVCILLVTIPLLAAVLISGAKVSDYLEQTIKERVDQTVGYLNSTLDRYFLDIRNITLLPLFDTELQSVLKGHTEAEQPAYLAFEEQLKVTEILSSPSYENITVRRTDLYLMDRNRLNAGSSVLKWDDSEEEWMAICRANPYQTFIIPWKDTLAMVRCLLEPKTGRNMGYIKVELEDNAIEHAISDVSLPPGSRLFIYNDANQCLYPFSDGDHDARVMEDEKQGDDVSGFVISSSTNLRVIVQMSMDSVRKDTKTLLSFAACIIIGAACLSWLFAVYASVRLTKPIVTLKDKMAMVAEGRFHTRMPVSSRDEIGQLEAMFNSMTESVETLINDVYEESLASKEAQISALQSQINPHFLYNTLETINMMAISCENYEVSEAVSNLGQMMHYCVSNEQHFATLEEEIKFVNAYYDIQRLRFDNLRSLTIDVGDLCRAQQVPKLLLQPFVENIVQHGMDDSQLDIVLSAYMEGEELVISIQNSGRPMTAQERALVNHKLSEAETIPSNEPWKPTGKGYGLSNVHRRLRLLFGENYGVFLDERYTQGARFILRLKPRKK